MKRLNFIKFFSTLAYIVMVMSLVFHSCKSTDVDNGQSNVKITKTVEKVEATVENVVKFKHFIKTINRQLINNEYYVFIIEIDEHIYLSRFYAGGFGLHLESCPKCQEEKSQYQLDKQKLITEIIEKQKYILQDMLSIDDYNELVDRLKNEFNN